MKDIGKLNIIKVASVANITVKLPLPHKISSHMKDIGKLTLTALGYGDPSWHKLLISQPGHVYL